MKFDKETISRQRFWFSLGGFMLLWLIALITVKASAGSKIDAEKKKFEKSKTDLEAQLPPKGEPKNESFWTPWDDQAAVLKSRIAVVHNDAWQLQKPRISFPGTSAEPLDKWWNNADSFADWFKRINEGTDSDAARDVYRNRLYRKQFDDLYVAFTGTKPSKNGLDKILAPVEFKGGYAGFASMMAPTLGNGGGVGPGIGGGRNFRGAAPGGAEAAGGRDIDHVFSRRPTPEEVWYAQEDFWVKSELLAAVRRTLDSVGKMSREEPAFWTGLGQETDRPDRVFTPYTPIEGKAEVGRKYVPEAECRFRNLDWEMHLAFEEEGGGKLFVSSHSTLRNVHPAHRVQSGTGTGPVDKTDKDAETKAPLLFRLTQRPVYYRLNDRVLKALRAENVPDKVLAKLHPLTEKDQYKARSLVLADLKKALSADELKQYQDLVLAKMKVEEAAKSWTLEVKTQDLAWNAIAEFAQLKKPEVDLNQIDPRLPFQAEQVFDWRSSPVRRIDGIWTCYHSHRDRNVPLKPHKILSKPPEGTDATATAQPATGTPGAPMPGAGAPGAEGSDATQPTEANGLERARYLNVTDTCRDMPFAMVVVVEQAHLHDFLVQVANSQLRIQITQAPFTRVRNVSPMASGDAAAPGGEQGNDRPQRGGPKAGGQVGPGGPGVNRGGGNPQAAADGTTDPNLVEVTVYGIAALYEKFPTPKPDAPKQ